MTAMVGRNVNSNDTAIINDGVELNTSTSMVIAPANPSRIYFHVNNDSSKEACWIKLQAASIDNDKKGIFLNKKEKPDTRWDMPNDNVYTGEISAIAEKGKPKVYVTEY